MRFTIALLFVAGLAAALPAPVANPNLDNGHISNGAMGANRVPCDPKNKANCQPGGGNPPPNDWQRGCSTIERCRHDKQDAPSNQSGQ